VNGKWEHLHSLKMNLVKGFDEFLVTITREREEMRERKWVLLNPEKLGLAGPSHWSTHIDPS